MVTQAINNDFDEEDKFAIEHYGRDYYEQAAETFEVLFKDVRAVLAVEVNWSPGVVRVMIQATALETERELVDSMVENIGGSLNDVSESQYSSGWEVRSYYIGDNTLHNAFLDL